MAGEADWEVDDIDLTEECPVCGEAFISTLLSLGKASAGARGDAKSQEASTQDTSGGIPKMHASPLEVGQKALDFILKGVHKGEVGTYMLDELIEDGPVLIAVYPFDFSPVCTQQLCSIQEMDCYEDKTELSITGLSGDGPHSHIAFAAQEELDFLLFSDLSGKMLEKYGVLWEESDGLKDVPRRSVFLIDADKTVIYRWITDDNRDEPGELEVDPVKEAIESV